MFDGRAGFVQLPDNLRLFTVHPVDRHGVFVKMKTRVSYPFFLRIRSFCGSFARGEKNVAKSGFI